MQKIQECKHFIL